MRIAYFVHELADAAVGKRIRMLTLAGADVALLGFDRDRAGVAAGAPDGIVLGRTQNRKLLRRMFAIWGAIPRALAASRLWRDADLIIARNLEMLALVRALTLGRRRPRIVYECLDIHHTMLSRGPVGTLVRGVERLCLGRADLIVTSSPAFERNYFRAVQRYRGRIIVAENKLLPLAAEMAPAPPAQAPWTMAWCGVLRCRRSFDLLLGVAEALEGRFRIELWGAPALDQIPHFHDALAGNANAAYRGAYKPEDLPGIYSRAHFSWAVDYYEAGGNSDWLLPNRLYESLGFACVPVAAAGVETARWLTSHGVGVVLAAPLEQTLAAFLSKLTPAGYEALRAAALQLDPNATRLTAESCRAFAAELARAPA
jgi:succinoglycan biosynthesis protein ExoL